MFRKRTLRQRIADRIDDALTLLFLATAGLIYAAVWTVIAFRHWIGAASILVLIKVLFLS